MNITKHLNTNNPHPRFTLKRIAFAVALSVASMAQGAPVGGVVVGGGANISSAGSNTTIVQSTPKAIINWQGFSIAPTESVRFIQPSSSAIILNRVMGPEASSILGNLSANGRVFLINPNGILFGWSVNPEFVCRVWIDTQITEFLQGISSDKLLLA